MNTHYGMLWLDTGSSYFGSQPCILLESSPRQGTAIPTALVYVNAFNKSGYHLLHSPVSSSMPCYDISNYCTLVSCDECNSFLLAAFQVGSSWQTCLWGMRNVCTVIFNVSPNVTHKANQQFLQLTCSALQETESEHIGIMKHD
jgi:hypothetical protein